jgi:glycosidase
MNRRFGDAGYDVADFYKVAPHYGTNEDFKNLCTEAHKRGIHVWLDLPQSRTHGFRSCADEGSTLCHLIIKLPWALAIGFASRSG